MPQKKNPSLTTYVLEYLGMSQQKYRRKLFVDLYDTLPSTYHTDDSCARTTFCISITLQALTIRFSPRFISYRAEAPGQQLSTP